MIESTVDKIVSQKMKTIEDKFIEQGSIEKNTLMMTVESRLQYYEEVIGAAEKKLNEIMNQQNKENILLMKSIEAKLKYFFEYIKKFFPANLFILIYTDIPTCTSNL